MADELPTYRHGQIPEGMATMTMLAGMRRRPRPGQPAVGWYPVRKGKVPLYAIADADELPAMSDKQHARWVANRTCARCGEVRADPVPLVDDSMPGRRVDYECRKAERLADARVSWLKLRMEAVAWARAFEIEQDGTGVILVGEAITGNGFDAGPVDLLAVDLDGNRLVNVCTWPSPYRNLWTGKTCWPVVPRSVRERGTGRRLARHAAAIDCDEIIPHLYPLLGRPVAYLTLGASGHPLELVAHDSNLWQGWHQSLFAGDALPTDRQGVNDIGARWRDWMCRPQHTQSPWKGSQGLQPQPLEADDPVAGVILALHCLTEMARDEHPDGPALCPVLPPDTGLEPCGEPVNTSGMCVRHGAALLLAA